MVAVWILFAVGIIAVILGLIPVILEVYAYLSAFIVTLGELIEKHIEIRRARIVAKKDYKEVLGDEDFEEYVEEKPEEVAEQEPVAEEVVEEAQVEEPEVASTTYTPEEAVVEEVKAEEPAQTEHAEGIVESVL